MTWISIVCISRYPVTYMEIATVTNISSEVKFYLTVYGCIAVTNTVFTAIRAFLFAYGGIRAATLIHNRVLDQVLKVSSVYGNTMANANRLGIIFILLCWG